MGPAAIGVHAFPVLLLERRVEPVEFMGELLAKAGSGSPSVDEETALQETLDMMSCEPPSRRGIDSTTSS